MNLPRIIAVDFDGALVSNAYPRIGEPNEFLIELLRKEVACGTKVILWTTRTGDRLIDAINWCTEHGIELAAANENLPEVVMTFGYDPRKVVADIYIDSHMCSFLNLPYHPEGAESNE